MSFQRRQLLPLYWDSVSSMVLLFRTPSSCFVFCLNNMTLLCLCSLWHSWAVSASALFKQTALPSRSLLSVTHFSCFSLCNVWTIQLYPQRLVLWNMAKSSAHCLNKAVLLLTALHTRMLPKCLLFQYNDLPSMKGLPLWDILKWSVYRLYTV